MAREIIMGRWLAIDWGEKYIGLAISDPLGIISQGLGVFENRGKKEFLNLIKKILNDYSIKGFVLGLPISLKGEETQRTLQIKKIGLILEKNFSLPVYFVDERFSTIEAEKVLIQGNVRREKRKIIKNQQSAIIILNKFLAQISS
ncbi:MAG: Holliday junction resolvase RuvX [Dictyoglomus sp.]|nr:Holliday junction resolvase RuvX [Dictyoglomus sp.]MCX7941809.1 Holliday junction resolvase RuvX [Dictyoglomaceae bacterium]MDW8188088.1 Holliday junction resolvase RuvX [Dictyoglomus sp.]